MKLPDNPRFPRLCAVLPAALAAIENYWAQYEVTQGVSSREMMERIEKAANAANARCLIVAMTFSNEYRDSDGHQLNRFSTLQQVFEPKTKYAIWGGFNTEPCVGGDRPGFFIECALAIADDEKWKVQ